MKHRRTAAVARHRRGLLIQTVEDLTVSAGQSSFTADDTDITANSSSTTTFSIVARNAGGFPVVGKTATIAQEQIAVSAANSSVSATPGTIASDGVDSCDVTIEVRDASDRPIPNIPAADVQIAVSGANNTITQPAQPTDANGRTTASFVSTGAGTKTVSATAGPSATAITDTASVVVSGTPVTGRANEPSGFTVINEWNDDAMPDAVGVNGFILDGPTTWGSKTLATSGYEGTPTIGGTATIHTAQTGGTVGGFDPQRIEFHALAGHGTELYMSVEAQWAAAGPTDYPFSTAPGGGKQFILWFTGGGRYILNCDASTGRWNIYENSTLTYLPLTGVGTFDMQRSFGEMEWYCDRGTGAADGTLRAYQKNVLIIEETGITFPAGDFDYFVVDHASNGNRPVTGVSPEVRVIATAGPGGSNIDVNVWTSAIYLSRP